jgi:hypothetical protein
MGNILTPNLTGSYYYNLIRTFNETQPANVIFQSGETQGNVSPLQGTKPVIKGGALAQAVIFSQTGSNTGFLQTMSFGSTIANYNFANNTTIQPQAVNEQITFNPNLIAPAVSGSTATTSSLSSDYIRILQSDPDSTVFPKLNIQGAYSEVNNLSADVIVGFQSSTDGSTWTDIYSENFVLTSPSSYNYSIIGPSETPIENTYYRAYLYYTCNSPGFSTPTFTISSGNFYITQNPPYSANVTSSYWSTGSSSKTILTGSQFNVDIYGITTQTPVSGSGYDSPYQTFNLQVGDEIRFSASENQVYQIISILTPSQNVNNTLYLTLDRPIVNGTILDSFLIRRFVPNPNYVIINATKNDSVGGGPGFLMPQYASQTLLDKFDSIIANLTEKGLI